MGKRTPDPLQQLAEALWWVVVAIDEREYYFANTTPFQRVVASERWALFAHLGTDAEILDGAAKEARENRARRERAQKGRGSEQ